MKLYVGMDVSLKETSICVVDDNGDIVSEGTVISDPPALAAFIKARRMARSALVLRPARPRPGYGTNCGLSVCR